jgi:hypothetical protein
MYPYGDGSAVSQVAPSIIHLDDASSTAVEIHADKLRTMLVRHHSYPAQHRKRLWSVLLQLPRNESEFAALTSRPSLPQAQHLCRQGRYGRRIAVLFNALVHWHASLIHCDWLPAFLSKLDRAFGTDPLFCFETAVTFLTNVFAEWLSEVPGPPADVLSRVDAILTNADPELRDRLGTGLVGWPVYRSCFAEVCYESHWYDLMDVVLSSSPQFLEFLVCAWVLTNRRQIEDNPAAFHATRRPINCDGLVREALKIERRTIASLKAPGWFRPLARGRYPLVEAGHDSVMLRLLQGDYDKLAELRQRLVEERRIADEAERTKRRRQQTYDAIAEISGRKEAEERAETARTAAELEFEVRRLRMEERRLQQAEERNFLDAWMREWDMAADLSLTTSPAPGAASADPVDRDGGRIGALLNLRQSDNMMRECRRASVTWARYARDEIENQTHETEVQNELRRMTANRGLLVAPRPVRSPAGK